MGKIIQHIGVIEKIEHSIVHVRIVQQSACGGCHANAFCPASNSSEKIIEIEDRSGNFSLNEQVSVGLRQSQGLTAVLIVFVVPLALVVLVLKVAGIISGGNEIVAGLAGLSTLIPYCGIIWLMRNKLKKKFVFTLSKITYT
ncbi:MAG: SoxR reducing system RseC family protein [Tannerella sp.]|jgi:sigma-E factor negative regulatory protein RseC|nr:SoxR reducing system RseC family protein [Tannerella sp.]